MAGAFNGSLHPATRSAYEASVPMPQDLPLPPPLLGAVEHLRDAVLIADPDGTVVYHNAAFEDRYGYDRATMNAAGGLLALFPEPEVSARLRNVLRHDTPFTQETNLCTHDGQILPTRVSAQFLPEDDVLPRGGIVCTLVDLSDQHRTREQLRLQAQIIAQIEEAVLAVDTQGLITFFNRGAEALYQVPAAEMLGQPVDVLLAQRHGHNGQPSFLAHALEAGTASEGEDLILLDDGRRCEVSIKVKPLREKGTPIGTLAILREITEKKRQEARIRHRIQVETALAEASRLLVSSGEVDFDRVLGVVGRAVGAESVYLVTIPPDHQPLLESRAPDQGMSLTVWHRDGRATDDWWPISLDTRDPEEWLREHARLRGHRLDSPEPSALAVPVLSHEDMLYGYLGFEYGDRPREELDEDIRVLNLLGDLLATYFERNFAEQALRESEERYRTFISTTTEAVWRLELTRPLVTDQPPEQQAAHLYEHSIFGECNQVMARLLQADDPADVVHRPLAQLLPRLDRGLIDAFIREGYTLHNHDYTAVHPESSPKHYVINAVGTVHQGRLIRIWGSCIEVTERVELERRMVAALEDQQQRIGRDLHDGVGQLLTGIRMLSANLAERHFREGDDGYEQAHKVSRFANEASQRVREIYRGLTPAQLYYEGLSAALEEIAYNTNALPNLSCAFVHDGNTDVWEREAKLHLYRIAQEAVNNALKHARAQSVVITLRTQNDHVLLQIEDDGRGFEQQERRGKSLGLDSMHYRARAIGANLTIHSSPGEGTVIRCLVPITPALTTPDQPGP